MKEPNATYLAELYRFSWPEDGIQAIVSRLDETKAGLFCELTVSTAMGLLREGRFNLTATNTRSQWVKALQDRAPDYDWYAAIERLCHLAMKHWREGEPAIDLRDVDPRSRPRWLYAPFIEYGGPTIFFADGGSGKSMLALAIAVCISTGRPLLGGTLEPLSGDPLPVLYCDWETDAETHAARLQAICAAAEPPIDPAPPIFYQRMSTTLAEGAATIRRRIGEHGARFVVVDSIGPARGGVAGDGSSETIRLHTAARSFGVPWCGVDHVAKGKESDKTRPFGSTYTHNLARVTWAVEKAPESEGGKLVIALVNHKANNGRTMPRLGYSVAIEEDDEGIPLSIRYDAIDVRDVPTFLPRLSQKDQLISVLKNGALTDAEAIAALKVLGVEITDATIRALISRYKDIFTRIYDEDRRSAPRVGLLSKAVTNG